MVPGCYYHNPKDQNLKFEKDSVTTSVHRYESGKLRYYRLHEKVTILLAYQRAIGH
jgi:hypothetical protein